MEAYFSEWLNLLVRWVHVIAGIMWIGDSLFFAWLDRNLLPPEKPGQAEGELWLVHSGGYYQVEKIIAPGRMPKVLHWFKWEAGTTWLSGVLLLWIVYYTGGALIDPATAPFGNGASIALGIAALVVSWAVYDCSWRLPLLSKAITFLLFCLLIPVIYGLCQVFTGRAAYIHVGAIFGTLMVANVWMRIIPAQRRMVQATREGRSPDVTLGSRAKLRSKHNHYLTYPVVFIMISSHFPSTYGHPLNWLILLFMIVCGSGVRLAINSHGRARALAATVAAACLGATLFLTLP